MTLLAVLAFALPAAPAQDLYDETVLRTLDLSFDQADWWQQLLDNKAAEIVIPADLTVDGSTYFDVGVRFKGNASYNGVGSSEKKPFKIRMAAFVDGQDLYGYENLNLNNAFHDPTQVREAVTYRVMRDYIAAPRANFVTLTINGENWGVYTNVEQCNKDWLDDWFADDEGNRYKGDAAAPGAPPGGTALTWLGSDPAPYALAYELKSENTPDPWTDLIGVCDALNNASLAGLKGSLDPLFSVDRACWYLALHNVFVALDSYVGPGHNFYLYHDPFHDRISLTPWDLNASFGIHNLGLSIAQLQQFDPLYKSSDPARPLVSRMLAVSTIRETYFAHIRTLLDEAFDWSVLGPLVSQYQALIDAAVQADTKKLYGYQDFLDNVSQDLFLGPGPAGNFWAPGLQPLVDNRRVFLLAHAEIDEPAPSIASVAFAPLAPTDAQDVTVTASVSATVPIGAVDAYWRVTGAFARLSMSDDGLSGDGAANDGVWGTVIPAQSAGDEVEVYVVARTTGFNGSAKTHAPSNAEHAPLRYFVLSSTAGFDVRINEFLAKNDAVNTDPQGDFDDWIEVVNAGSEDADLTGAFLTDDLANPTKWSFPDGAVLAPGKLMLIWADEDGSDGDDHANFKLAVGGEEIGLFAADGVTVLDSIIFGPQAADISTGRLVDGVGPWVILLTPTPDSLNDPGTCGTRGFDALDPTQHPVRLSMVGSPAVDSTTLLETSAGPALGTAVLCFSLAPAYFPFDTGIVLVDLTTLATLLLPLDAAGSFTLPLGIPSNPGLAGLTLVFQSWCVALDASLSASNAIEATICP